MQSIDQIVREMANDPIGPDYLDQSGANNLLK